jgi:multidrug efflux pump subunit AcrB
MLWTGQVRINFFEGDPLRLFYVSLEMPSGTTLEQTADKLNEIEAIVLDEVTDDELRGTVSIAGQMWTETAPLFGDRLGQVMVSLNSETRDSRHVYDVEGAVLARLAGIDGTENITILRMDAGVDAGRDIEVKIRGDNFDQIGEAATDLKNLLDEDDHFFNVSIDYQPGNPEMILSYNGEAIKRTGVNPSVINRSLRALIDGELVSFYQDEGEEVTVRVINNESNSWHSVDDLLRQNLSLPDGRSVSMGELVSPEYTLGEQNIQHYDFKRSITLFADIDKELIDSLEGAELVTDLWNTIKIGHPNNDLEFSGILDDIEQSIDDLILLGIIGIGLIYIILGTQFRSYFQPFMIMVTVPLAIIGVVLGLIVTSNPLSLYTMYGLIALAGISVNSAIVLISAANDRLARGMGLLHATIYAARRRVIPILITSLTTIAGLFSLSAGLAGKSLVWGPVATAIVWGLAFSTVLTLMIIPLLYRTFMGYSYRVKPEYQLEHGIL